MKPVKLFLNKYFIYRFVLQNNRHSIKGPLSSIPSSWVRDRCPCCAAQSQTAQVGVHAQIFLRKTQ